MRPYRPSTTLLPMTWGSTGYEWLFPHLETDIEIAPLGADQTHLSICGRYEPRRGAFGRILDPTLLYRVAEATVKDLLDRVANTRSGDDLSGTIPACLRFPSILGGRAAPSCPT